jgi:4-amino-4-deoxy-L-arabinose transferase-like glycosyltransferase
VNPARRRARWWLPAILLLFVALATWYSLAIPLGEAPDEVPHFTYVRYLARHGRLPETTDEHEAFQPPLYYMVGAALTFWVKDHADAPFAVRHNAQYDAVDPRAPKNLLLHTSDEAWPFRGWALAWHLVRILSIALGATTVWAIYRLGSLLFPAQAAVPLAMAGLAAFTPQFLFLSAVANNDNAAIAISALVLWQAVAALHDWNPSQFWRRRGVLGLLLGLGLLSKGSLLALVPVVVLALLVAPTRWRRRKQTASGPTSRSGSGPASWSLWWALGGLAVTLGIAVAVAGWYFARNWVLYGDPLAWSFVLATNALREGPLTLDVLVWLCRGVFRSFWLGWIGIAFEGFIYRLLAAVCLVAAAGFATWLIRSWRSLSLGFRWVLGLLGLHAAITLASLLQWTATVLGTDQGRLLYPLFPTVMLVLAVGWAWWAGKRGRRGVLAGLVGGMLLLAVITPLRYIRPVHAPAPVATQEELAAAEPLEADWDGIRLLAYRLEEQQVVPGQKLALDLYWQALEPVEEDLMALIQLVDSEGRFVMYADGSPTAGRDTTDRWSPGVPLSSRHLLPVPKNALPGEYWLTISIHAFGQAEWLLATSPQGTVLGDHLLLPDAVTVAGP